MIESFIRRVFTRKEQSSDLATFSVEQRHNLERLGYAIYCLTGKSIAKLRKEDRVFWDAWLKDGNYENEVSISAEVAINPHEIFLPESNRKTWEEQQNMMTQLSMQLAREVPGIKVILGTVADYAELSFIYQRAVGVPLFGYTYDRTTTSNVMDIENRTKVAAVGRFHDNWGRVTWPLSSGQYDHVWAAPLLVPAQTSTKPLNFRLGADFL